MLVSIFQIPTLLCYSKPIRAWIKLLSYLKTNILLFNLLKDDSKESKKSLGSLSGDASAEEDAILEELAMIHRNPSTTSLQNPILRENANVVEQDHDDEERDSFHLDDIPSPLSLPSAPNPGASLHRPIPMLSRVGGPHGQHPRLTALQASSGQCSLPVVSTPTSGDPTAPLGSTPGVDLNSNNGGKTGMSRSISDSTLRRAALHLNLNQSVLPSFTSLQQFKVQWLKVKHAFF